MGKKSDKKVKSERVNVLRKQYDAFLEEDKKRKERNEYILGRLDNMRYSATAVQIRHKPIVYGDVMPVFNRGGYRTEPFDRREQFDQRDVSPHPDPITRPNHNLQRDVQRNYLDNTSLLKEISKQYILIPKLRTSLVDNYIGTIPPQSLPPIAVSSPKSNVNNNEDWKSKYDILNQLKNKEKEEPTDKYANEDLYPVKDKQVSCKDDINVSTNLPSKQNIDEPKTPQRDNYALQNYNIKDIDALYEQHIAEKESPTNKIESDDHKNKKPSIDQSQNSDALDYTKPETSITQDSYQLQSQYAENYAAVEDSVPATNNLEQNVYDGNYPIQDVVQSEYTNNEVLNNIEHQINDIPQQEVYPAEYEQPVAVEGAYPDPQNVYLDQDDYSPIQVLEPSAVVEQIHNEPAATVQDTNAKEEEVVEYPIEMLNVQEFTPKEDVQLIDGENVNPKYYASEDNTEKVQENNPQTTVEETVDPQDNSSIEAFDAEQREMFYSENTSEYVHDQQQNNAYTEEYANPPAQDYSYYESPATALQEQEYPVEINEHEESNARYDQNYEQQYATEYGQEYEGQEQQQYVQNEGYDQTEQNYDQQYVQQEGYDPAQQYQDYQYQQADHETAQNVEQVLDTEAGYVEQQAAEAAKAEEQPAAAAAQGGQKTV